MKHPTWFRILEAARRLDKEEVGITCFTLGHEAKITPAVASGWLSKFARWQYVTRGMRGKTEESARWVQVFELTEWGHKKRAPRRKIFKS